MLLVVMGQILSPSAQSLARLVHKKKSEEVHAARAARAAHAVQACTTTASSGCSALRWPTRTRQQGPKRCRTFR